MKSCQLVLLLACSLTLVHAAAVDENKDSASMVEDLAVETLEREDELEDRGSKSGFKWLPDKCQYKCWDNILSQRITNKLCNRHCAPNSSRGKYLCKNDQQAASCR